MHIVIGKRVGISSDLYHPVNRAILSGVGDSEQVVMMFVDGVKPRVIMETFNISLRQLAEIVADSDETEDTSSYKHRFNHNYFRKIDTDEKAYWLGFLFGDGNVSSRLQDVSIAQSGKDRSHLVKFAKAIGGTEKMVYATTNIVYPESPHAKINIRSRLMALSLIDKGCWPNKSLVVGPPEKVLKKYIKHFIRGLVDADGGIYIYPKLSSLELVGSYDLLKWVSEQGPTVLTGPRPHKSIYRIRSRADDVYDWVKWLYEDSTVYLDRKYERALQVIDSGPYESPLLLHGKEGEVARSYNRGESINSLASGYEVSDDVIRRLLATAGTPLRRPIRYSGAICSHTGCEQPRSGQYCYMHYERNRKGQDMDAPKRVTL